MILVLHLIHEASQLRMFLNSKDQVYIELSNNDEAVGIALDSEEVGELYRKLESLIFKADSLKEIRQQDQQLPPPSWPEQPF